MKIVCIYHRIDLDGWMSAAIVAKWYINNNVEPNLHIEMGTDKIVTSLKVSVNIESSLDFIGYNYGEALPNLSEYDKVIMVDVCFPKEEMLSLNKRLGKKSIWIDHHQRSVDEVNAYIIENGVPMEGLVTEPGEFKAACELSWEYFFPHQPMPELVRLLGRYDSFQHKGTDEERKVLEFQYGARQVISNVNEAYSWLTRRGSEEVHIDMIHKQGKAIYDYLCTEAKQAYANGFSILLIEQGFNLTADGTRPAGPYEVTRNFICINKERFNPVNFGINYHAEGYAGAACFHRTNNGRWVFSFYNENGTVDCSAIAKYFGGGGHKGAAGCVVEDLNWVIG